MVVYALASYPYLNARAQLLFLSKLNYSARNQLSRWTTAVRRGLVLLYRDQTEKLALDSRSRIRKCLMTNLYWRRLKILTEMSSNTLFGLKRISEFQCFQSHPVYRVFGWYPIFGNHLSRIKPRLHYVEGCGPGSRRPSHYCITSKISPGSSGGAFRMKQGRGKIVNSLFLKNWRTGSYITKRPNGADGLTKVLE